MQCHVLGEEEKIDALYGGAEPAVARRVRQHLETCSACRDEMRALQGTRRQLSLWTLPESAQGSRARSPLSWGLPLAAAVLLALGAAITLRGSAIRYEGGNLSFRLGPPADESFRQLLAQQDARHQREMGALRASLAQPSSPASTLKRADVLTWIRESEARQSQRFLARVEELQERSDAQRRLDMARVSAGLSYLDGKSGQHVARTSELMNSMLQASHKR